MPETTPRTLVDVRVEFSRRGNAAQIQAGDTPAHPTTYAQGLAEGWSTAVAAVTREQQALSSGDEESLERLIVRLDEHRREASSLTAAKTPPLLRSGRIDALTEAIQLTQAALSLVQAENPETDPPPPPPPAPAGARDADDLGDWSGYPRLPMGDLTLADMHHLALFLGGDNLSFTGDLLRLIARADPENLNRIAAGFPRHVRAFLLWRACAPVPASTLVTLLEATSMIYPREALK